MHDDVFTLMNVRYSWLLENRAGRLSASATFAAKIGCVPQRLHDWFRRDETNAWQRPSITSAEVQRVKELEREVKELRQVRSRFNLA